ncbi:MAG TPA: DOMON-like domain-containing protein [Rhizomicrobium sp.]|jgi:hypothetical protein
MTDLASSSQIRAALKLHPLSGCDAVESIEVDILRSGAYDWLLRYRVTGNLRDIRLPLPRGHSRADELWRHTCFELFLRRAGQESYYEFNFAPSLQWAAYRFDGYRQGMRNLEIPPPRIAIRQDENSLELQATPNFGKISGLGPESDWQLGASAIIENTGGGISYWALAHPPGKPDFHHAEAFVLYLSA